MIYYKLYNNPRKHDPHYVSNLITAFEFNEFVPFSIYNSIDISENRENLNNNLETYNRIASLTCIDHNSNSLIECVLPPVLPQFLHSLVCTGNCLQHLPQLPDSLEVLSCSHNNILNLPPNLKSINILRCFNNYIQCLPDMRTDMSLLFANDNNITEISKSAKNAMKYIYEHDKSCLNISNNPILHSITIKQLLY
jgi:hypothetical protein